MMDELINDFVSETRENLESLTSQVLNWEKNPKDGESVDSIFRFVHTVKGSCGFLDLPRLLALSHAAEDIMSEARDGKILPTKALVTAVLAVVDRIAILTEAIQTNQAINDNDSSLINAMYSQLDGARSAVVNEIAKEELTDAEDKFGSNYNPIKMSSNSINIENITMDDDANEPIEDQDDILDASGNINDMSGNRTVRVSLKLLDNLMSGVSDLVLARNEVSRKLRDVIDGTDVDSAFGRLSSSVAEMRDAVGLMRMQNIDRLFSSLPRMVRDINEELGKDIELKIDGGEVEVDREMVEALRDPLKHIIRNAADHGIESKEDRIAAGKNPSGTIMINARQSGNQILIEIIDDGAGIDLSKLRGKVIASKLMSASKWESLSEKAKLDMIFSPGLSTAKSVTAISGRGVGMDVVRTNITRISGTIDIENLEGEGLKLTLSLPLTLSIIAGLSLRCGDQMFAISRNSVQELILHTNKNVAIEEVGGTQIACIRGQRFPYARLCDLVDVDGDRADSYHNNRTLVVVKPAVGISYVIDVDAVLDNEELVVKPGAPLLMASGLYAGTSLPDNGRPLLLLDANAVATKIGLLNNAEDYVSETTAEEDSSKEVKRKSALLFVALDGSQKAIRLAVLDRLEEVDARKIGNSGGMNRVNVNDRLYEIFGLDSIPDSGTVKMLRLSDGDQWKFLAVAEVLDIFKLDDELAPSQNPEKIEGVLTISDKQIELVNPYQFFEHGAVTHVSQESKPLCYIDCQDDDEWSNKMLLPLLNAAGYRVSTDHNDADMADVVLAMESRESAEPMHAGENRVNLRQNLAANENKVDSIYRYDRLGLLAAIEAKISKG